MEELSPPPLTQDRIVRPRTVLKRWVGEVGPFCPGAYERAHEPHDVESLNDLSLDHIVPKSKGGRARWENLRVLCKTENLHKGPAVPTGRALRLARATALDAYWATD